MRLAPWLFLLYLTLVSWIITSVISGYVLWSLRKTNGNSRLIELLALCQFGIFLKGWLHLCANAFNQAAGIVPPPPSRGFIWCFWLGHAAFVITQWQFTLYLLRYKKEYGP